MQDTYGEGNLVPVEKYAKEKGLSSDEVVQLIKGGKLTGLLKGEKWYVDILLTDLLHVKRSASKKESPEEGELIIRANVRFILELAIFGNFSTGIVSVLLSGIGWATIIAVIFLVAINVLLLLSVMFVYVKLTNEGFVIHLWGIYKNFKWSEISTIELKGHRWFHFLPGNPPHSHFLSFRFTDSYWNKVGRKRKSRSKKSVDYYGDDRITSLHMGRKPEKMLELFTKWKAYAAKSASDCTPPS